MANIISPGINWLPRYSHPLLIPRVCWWDKHLLDASSSWSISNFQKFEWNIINTQSSSVVMGPFYGERVYFDWVVPTENHNFYIQLSLQDSSGNTSSNVIMPVGLGMVNDWQDDECKDIGNLEPKTIDGVIHWPYLNRSLKIPLIPSGVIYAGHRWKTTFLNHRTGESILLETVRTPDGIEILAKPRSQNLEYRAVSNNINYQNYTDDNPLVSIPYNSLILDTSSDQNLTNTISIDPLLESSPLPEGEWKIKNAFQDEFSIPETFFEIKNGNIHLKNEFFSSYSSKSDIIVTLEKSVFYTNESITPEDKLLLWGEPTKGTLEITWMHDTPKATTWKFECVLSHGVGLKLSTNKFLVEGNSKQALFKDRVQGVIWGQW